MKILSIITTIYIGIYVIRHKDLPIAFSFSNALFIIGLIYLCIAFAIHIRNLGLFKFFSYYKYKKQVKHYNKDFFSENDLSQSNSKEKQDKPIDFYDFYIKKYSEKWSTLIFYKFSIPLLILSLIIAIFSRTN